jgi:hypothetical protein
MSEPDIPSQLCVGCGMCCDGTLYERASVAPGEEERMAATGLELFGEVGNRSFRQPCPHSDCGRCTIYETRFEICRTFECSLLRSVESGDLSLSEAKGKIATAQQLLEKVIEIDPAWQRVAARNSARALLAEQMATSDDLGKRAGSERLLNIVALESYLSRWFRHKKAEEDDEMAAPPPS